MGHTKSSDGFYHIKGGKYEILCGSRAQVMHGTAYKTSGGLTKSDLIQNKNGRIVSKKKHNHEKNYKRLAKHGYTAKKGKFGAVRMSAMSSRRSSRRSMRRSSKRSRGGATPPNPSMAMPNSQSQPMPSQPMPSQPMPSQPMPSQPMTMSGQSTSGGKRGGYSNGPLTPAGAHANYQISNSQGPNNPQIQALMAGAGKNRASMSRNMLNGGKRGGYSNSALNPAGAHANYQISNSQGPNNPQIQALMAGAGKNRASMSRNMLNGGKRGGYSNGPLTPAGADANYKISNSQGPNNPTMQALMASGGRKRGGYSNSALNPAGADANYKISNSQGPNNPTMQALMASS